MDNRQIIEKVSDAFTTSDTETILSYMTEDVSWHMLGDSVISGKEKMRVFFTKHPDMKMLSCTKDHVLLDGNTASIDGEVQCADKSGKVYNMYYCDVYELENGKVKKMISYTVNKKKDE